MSSLISVLAMLLVAWAVLAPLAIPAAWRVLRSDGRSGWLSLLLLVPYAGMIALLLILQTPARGPTWASAS